MKEIKNIKISDITSTLLQNEEIDSRWLSSPFLALKQLHAKQAGKRFEEITREVLSKAGHKIETNVDTDYDMIMNGKKCEIKGSTIISGHDDRFSFLQIRPEQVYDELVFSCFYFDRIEIYKITKEEIKKYIAAGQDPKNKGKRGRPKKGETKPTLAVTFKKQHGGNKGESGTYLYHGNPKRFAEHILTVK